MLEANDLDVFRIFDPFSGAIMGCYCDESKEVPIPKFLVGYADIVLLLTFRASKVIGWHGQRLSYVTESTKIFKEIDLTIISPYHKSGIGTVKKRMLDHAIDDLRRADKSPLWNGGLFENAHANIWNTTS